LKKIAEQKAIQLASEFARRQGYDITNYEATANRIREGWHVFFRPKKETKPAPGDFFSVRIANNGSVLGIFPGK
jgi:hypothetical protein